MTLKEWLAEISIPVYIFVIFFAISSWVDINGLWVELPVMVNHLPEGWNLPSYLAIIMQVGNIGPLLFLIANRLAKNHVKEWPVVYVIIGIGAASCLLLAFLWNTTTIIGSVEHSTWLFVLSSCLALVDCISSVVFLPYMSIFKPQYMTAYFIGDGLSGLIPGLVGLAQGLGGDAVCVNTSTVIPNKTTGKNITIFRVEEEYQEPVFSVQTFFFFLFALICMSGISFSFLQWTSFCKRETIRSKISCDIGPNFIPVNQVSESPETVEKDLSNKDIPSRKVSYRNSKNLSAKAKSRDDDERDLNEPSLSKAEYALLLFFTLWINMLSIGVLNVIQTYALIPYGHLVYSLSVRLGKVSDPLACFFALLVPSQSLATISVLTFIGTVFTGYQIFLVAMSPTAPLQGELEGKFLCVSIF